MVKRAQFYSHLGKFLASVTGRPFHEGGLWHMLGYLCGQITAAVREDIRSMRGHDPYLHPRNRIVLKGWALGTLRCGGLVGCRDGAGSIGLFRTHVGPFIGSMGLMLSVDLEVRTLVPAFSSRTCSWPSSMTHTQRSRRSWLDKRMSYSFQTS